MREWIHGTIFRKQLFQSSVFHNSLNGGLCVRQREQLIPDQAGVAAGFQEPDDLLVVDLSRTRLMTAWRVGNMDMADLVCIAAELISKCIPRNGRILAMCGNLEFDGHCKRLAGFGARMQELQFPNSQIEVTETYNDYYFTCRRVTEALARTPDLAAIYMANQSIAGCAQALKTAGRTQDICLVVHDLSDNTRTLLQNGCVDFTISQDFYRQGYLPLKCLRELLHLGKQPDIDQTNTYISVICSQNMD